MYVASVLTAGMICAMADTLMPEGAVKRVGKLVCGMVLLCAVLEPLLGLDLSAGEYMIRSYLEGISREELRLDQEVDSQMKDIIEEECAAYIVDKAAQLGVSCRAWVICESDENGIPVPWSARVSGDLTQAERDALSQMMEEDLTIPDVRQEFEHGEAVA